MLSYLTLHSTLHVGYASEIASYIGEDREADSENDRGWQHSPGGDSKTP